MESLISVNGLIGHGRDRIISDHQYGNLIF
jgi:hypothetical protein